MFSDYNEDQIQAAKDFLWDNIEQHNRELLAYMVVNNSKRDDEDLDIIFRDPIIIGFRYKHLHSREESNPV